MNDAGNPRFVRIAEDCRKARDFTERSDFMRKMMITFVAAAALAGCTNAQQGAVVGGVGGAALGTLAGGNDTRNALVGGAIGAVAGTLIGASMDRQGYCRYRDYDRNGRAYIYEAPCR
jgi:hypothetical protein